MSAPHPLCYLDGDYLAIADAKISVFDRSFLFGDGVYEVIPVYDGKPFLADAHLRRLENSLAATQIQCDTDFRTLIAHLIEQNGSGDMGVYLQVSRGAYGKRDHRIPKNARTTVFAMTHPFPKPGATAVDDGLDAALCDDFRWLRCDIKSTSLLANVLLRQQASEKNADEAILVRDGIVTEGASSSIFVVAAGRASTSPDAHTLLPGTTRDFVVRIAREQGIEVEMRHVAVEELDDAEEIWICSALRELLPITRIDGKNIGDGKPGPVWRRVYDGFQAAKRRPR